MTVKKAVKKRPREPKQPKSPLKLPTPWENAPESVEGLEGFVYLITHTPTQRRYLGRKYFWAKTRVKVPGKVRRKRKTKESDWRHYKSSSDELKQLIEEEGSLDNFTFEILSVHETRAQCNYEEVRQQFIRDVLNARSERGDYTYLNSNIQSRYFRGKV